MKFKYLSPEMEVYPVITEQRILDGSVNLRVTTQLNADDFEDD